MTLTSDLDEAFRPWADSLTEDEIEALRYYQGPNHEWINRVLRYPDAVLTSDQSKAVPGRRRRGLRDYGALFGDTQLRDLPGEEIHDPAFVSTSVSAHRAERFMDKDEGFRLEFDVPTGHSAAWLPLVGSPELAGQRELLLPRETEVRVVDAWFDEAILYVEGRLL